MLTTYYTIKDYVFIKNKAYIDKNIKTMKKYRYIYIM